ncbi:MAG: hypothetical protein ACLUNQ_00855 [Oscillospiraceae bacterium]
MNHTFGYVLCCQSPALFLLATALVIDFFVRKGRARLRAILALLGAGVCIGLGFVLYYQGMLQEYFEVKNFWRIRAPGWVGLVLAAALLVYVLVKAIARASARRTAQKEAARAENARKQEMESAKNAAYEAGRADALSGAAAFQGRPRRSRRQPLPGRIALRQRRIKATKAHRTAPHYNIK